MEKSSNSSLDSYYFYRDWKKNLPIIEKGEGIYIFDKNGKRYIDGSGGPCVVSIGHGVKEVIEAIKNQLDKICYPYVGHFSSDAQIELAQRVLDLSPPTMSKVAFYSGGSEANETALKVARQYHLEKGNSSKTIFITRWKSYHGATLGTLSMSGHVKRREDYIPYLHNFPHIYPPYCYRCDWGKNYPDCGLECAYELEKIISLYGANHIAAFIAEPIIGNAAGAVVPPDEYWPIIRSICDKYDIVLVADEVITGFGRTGKNFAVDHWNIVPDIITSGKGICSGYNPLGAVVINEKIWDVFRKSKRSSFFTGYTYSGNPLTCSAGAAVLKYVKENNLVTRSEIMGSFLFEKAETLADLNFVGDVRGRGLLIGIEIVKDKTTKEPFKREDQIVENITSECFSKGLILMGGSGGANGTDGDHIVIAPPFTVTESEIEEIIEILANSISRVLSK